LSAVFTSDLRRAVEIAFERVEIPVFHDWRLRECNYGRLNGCPAAEVHGDRMRYLDEPYPGGESWRQAVQRVGRVFEDLKDASFYRVLIVGHIATRWACDHLLAGVSLEDLAAAEFTWREGWEYDLGALAAG
jgi:broad specificity phosphatase PhoE